MTSSPFDITPTHVWYEPISFGTTVVWPASCWARLAEGTFDLGQERVRLVKHVNDLEACEKISSREHLGFIILKILLIATIIFPLVMLIVKGAYRNQNRVVLMKTAADVMREKITDPTQIEHRDEILTWLKTINEKVKAIKIENADDQRRVREFLNRQEQVCFAICTSVCERGTSFKLKTIADIASFDTCQLNKNGLVLTDLEKNSLVQSLAKGCEEHHLGLVDNLVKEGYDFCCREESSLNTPLIWAIANARFSFAWELITEGPNDPKYLNVKSDPLYKSNAALHVAIGKGYKDQSSDKEKLDYSSLDLVKAMVKKGADINLQNDDGNTPLHLAYLRRDLTIVSFLKDSGARDDILNNDGKKPSQLLKEPGLDAAMHVLDETVKIFALDPKEYDAALKARTLNPNKRPVDLNKMNSL